MLGLPGLSSEAFEIREPLRDDEMLERLRWYVLSIKYEASDMMLTFVLSFEV